MMKIYFSLILSIIFFNNINIQAANSALCFLTYRPIRDQLKFIQQLAEDALEYDVNVFIMIDDNRFNVSLINTSSNLQLLEIPNEKCLQYNYQKTILLDNKLEITAWDKALLYFALLNKNYSFVWLIENDVFIPSTKAFRSLHELYSNTSDLIVPRNDLNLLGNQSFWLWSMAAGVFTPPWFDSMVNVVGLSRRMLTAIDKYVQWLGEVPFHEFFFHTLAMQLNFTVVTPTELSTDVYRADYEFEDIRKRPNNLWHPVKDYNMHNVWQQRLANISLKANHSFELTNVEMLFHTNHSMTSVEKQLTNLLAEFEIQKSQFSSNNRRLLRQYFTYLAKQCHNQNATKEIISLAKQLADHAYKLPEAPIGELVRNKSAHHIQLEQTITNNRELILRSISNISIVNELRKQNTHLIRNLTFEIQREYKEEHEFQNQTKSSSLSSSTATFSTSRLFSSTQMSVPKVNYEFDQLTKQTSKFLEDNIKILFLLIITNFCMLMIFLKWKRV